MNSVLLVGIGVLLQKSYTSIKREMLECGSLVHKPLLMSLGLGRRNAEQEMVAVRGEGFCKLTGC